MNKNQCGLTLIELLITLGVVSILMSVAIPSFQGFTVRNNSIAQISDLMVDLQFARNEAAKIGAVTRVCVGNSTGCKPGWGTGWRQGWVVVVNGTNTALRVHPAIGNGEVLTSLDNVTLSSAVEFNRYGFSTPRVFKLCDELNRARAVLLSRTGRIRLATDTDVVANGLVDDANNNDISCP